MNCLLYARVSTDRQAKKDLSIPAQLTAMKEFAKKNHWRVIGHYVDRGESARTAQRPELKKLIAHCKQKKDVNIVLVHKIDRLARNLEDHAMIKAILKRHDIRLASVTEPLEDNPVGQLLENVIASISQWYSANLAEEVKKAARVKLERGEWPTHPPLGYKSVKGENNRPQHVPDPEKRLLIEQAFELYATGSYSLPALADELAFRGLKSRNGRRYNSENMKRLLMNRFYIGTMVWKGREYQGKHEPLVKPLTFHRVQAMLRKRGVDTGLKGRLPFLLRGLAECQSCGRKLTAERHARGCYYRCLPRYDGEKCREPYVAVDRLDGQLEALYQNIQPSKKVLELLRLEMQEIAAKRQQIAEKELARCKRQAEKAEAMEMKLLDEMLSGKIERTLYEKLAARYRQQREEAEIRITQCEEDYQDPLDFLDKCIVVSSMLSYLHQKLSFEHRRALAKAVFETIKVKDRKIVNVRLHPPFSYLIQDDMDGVFETVPFGTRYGIIFEHLVRASLAPGFHENKAIIESIATQITQILSLPEKANSSSQPR